MRYLLFFALATSLHARSLDVVIVRGADGAEEYGKKFTMQVEAWKTACAKGEVPVEVIEGEDSSAQLEKRLAEAKPDRSLWLVLIGHGTFDGREAKLAPRGRTLTRNSSRAGWRR